jgi:putative sigma-54 modulation protein
MGKGSRTPGGVTVHVKGKNISITPALHDQVVHKMGRLDKYFDLLHDIDVELCTEKTRESIHHNHVEATARVAGRTIRVTAEDADMYAAIDDAVDKLYRQLNRKKERLKGHHGTKFVETLPVEEIETTDDVPENGTPAIRVERLNLKPIFEDEALAELEDQNRSFYVFLNASSEQVNVLYRRADGSYGLIEPRFN